MFKSDLVSKRRAREKSRNRNRNREGEREERKSNFNSNKFKGINSGDLQKVNETTSDSSLILRPRHL